MKRVLALSLLLVAGCVARTPQPGVETAQANSAPVAVTGLTELLPEGHHAGAMVEVNGAQIVAIVADSAPKETPYIVLDEAMKAGVCTIRETGSVDENGQQVNGDVNTLLVTNTGDKPVFLMAGDLVLGGKQDRVLAESVVVDPGTRDMGIPVFCVEHGRWAVQGKDGEAATKGHFMNAAKTGQVDMTVKQVAIASGNQSRVWERVATTNTALGVGASTGTFRAAYDDEKTRAELDNAYTRAAKLVTGSVVGFAVVYKGDVAAMDVFDSSDLAAKVSEKLLRSYIITAIGGGYELPLEAKLARQSVTLSAEDVPIADAAHSLSQQLGMRVVVEEGLTGNVTLDFNRIDGAAAITTLAERADAWVTVQGETMTLSARGNEGPTLQFAQLQGVQTRAFTQTMTGGQVDAEPSPPTECSPNDRTFNARAFEKESVKYSCEDKKTGRKVQTSYMRR